MIPNLFSSRRPDGEAARENCDRESAPRSSKRQTSADVSAGFVQMPHRRRAGPRDGGHRVHGTADRRCRRRFRANGPRQGLLRGDDALGRFDGRQDGAHFLRPDRIRRGQRDCLDGRTDGAWTGGSDGLLAFPLQPQYGRQGAFPRRIQSRVRLARAGNESRSRRRGDGPHFQGMGRGRHGVQLENSQAYRRVPAQDGARARNSEIRFRAQCPYFCSRLQRLGAGN